MQQPEVVAEGIVFPEGLAWSDRDGTLVCTGVQEGTVWRVWPDEGRKETIASFAGGANNVALAADGGCLVNQNGGIDARAAMLAIFPDMVPLPEPTHADPGMLRIHPSGEVEYLIASGLNCPNDLVVAPTGDILITDPGNPFSAIPVQPRLMRFTTDGSLEVVSEEFVYCNGLFATDDEIVVVDHHGLVRVMEDGSVETIVAGIGDPAADGITVDRDGRIYAAGGIDMTVTVVEDGEVVEVIPIPGNGLASNVAFGGPDGTWLFATDAAHGKVFRWKDMPTPGYPVKTWAP